MKRLIVASLLLVVVASSSYSLEGYKYESCVDPYVMVHWQLAQVDHNAVVEGYGRAVVGFLINPDPSGQFSCVPKIVIMIVDMDDETGRVRPFFIISYIWETEGAIHSFVYDKDSNTYKEKITMKGSGV
jgi:hypothetical protein